MQGKKELQVSLYQACVLLLFNDMPTMSYSVIKENSGIGECSNARHTKRPGHQSA